MRRHNLITRLLAIALMMMAASVFAGEDVSLPLSGKNRSAQLTPMKEVEAGLERPGLPLEKSTSADCYWQNYAITPYYYWRLPDPVYGDEAYAMRFSVSGAPETLKTVAFAVYDPGNGTFGNDTIFLRTQSDLGGLPDLDLSTKILPPGTYSAYPSVTTVDFSSDGLTFTSDFHVAISTSGSSGEYESILSDDGSIGTNRSSVYTSGNVWDGMLNNWGVDVNFLIAVELCKVPPISIAGRKFHDMNGNSLWEPGLGETGLANFPIELTKFLPNGTVEWQNIQLTNGSGNYLFAGLTPGSYTVEEDVIPSGGAPWVQTFPLSVFYTLNNLQWGDNRVGLDFGNDSCDHHATTTWYQTETTCIHGTNDNFNVPEPSYMSPDLYNWLVTTANSFGAGVITNFDQPASDDWFGHTFEGCWDHEKCEVVQALLTLHLRANPGQPYTDFLGLGDWSQGGRIWSILLNDLENYDPDEGPAPWNSGDEMTVTLNLASLPPSSWLPTNILAVLQDGNLDMFVSDETEVDYIELYVELCCGCYADGDANNDSVGLTAADLAYLAAFINGCGPAPIPLNSCDLNGDGVVDAADLQLYQDYFVYGIGVFAPYGGYPVPGPCNPSPAPPPDTVRVFGLEHTSVGTACLDTSGGNLIVSRLGSGDDGVSINLGAASRFDAKWLELDPAGTLPDGASLTVTAVGQSNIAADQVLGIVNGYKSGAGWEFSADFSPVGGTTQEILVYSGDSLVARITGDTGPAFRMIRNSWGDWHAYIDSLFVVEIGCTFSFTDSMFLRVENGDIPVVGDAVYIRPEDATVPIDFIRNIDFLAADIPTITFTDIAAGCCQDMRGNVDGDSNDQVNVADLTYLVAYLFQGGDAPPCIEEADVNGSGSVDIADLTYLVAFIFQGGELPYNCGETQTTGAAKTYGGLNLNSTYDDGETVISIETPVDIRGIQMDLSGVAGAGADRLTDGAMEFFFRPSGNTARVGIVDLEGEAVIAAGKTPLVRLKGEWQITDALASDRSHTAIAPQINQGLKEAALPAEFALHQSYPNPFNPSTQISFSLPNAGRVALEVFNLLGQHVVTLVDEFREAGAHSVTWDGTDAQGQPVSTGVYLYRLEASGFSATRKMMLLK
ncbi:MAG TPA: dockerin type I domain-containing protein [Candidatus Deferrimicrobium sp.]|nr:dockerin type I domain-containing protein [Candidatus Deferrimicrobium sp.]